jgi:hypothetical protein
MVIESTFLIGGNLDSVAKKGLSEKVTFVDKI